jgi:hypothetical protein
MELTDYDGKRFALLLCGETEQGEDDWVVFPGIARLQDGILIVQRPEGQPPFQIRSEWYNRIKSVGDEIREMLHGAEYVLPLTVGPKPGVDDEQYIRTGLMWPK